MTQRAPDSDDEQRDEIVRRMIATKPQPKPKEKGRELKPAPKLD